ncbi:Imm21 family immunity protein [Kitasatospora azatica]|uniref:Imm21 family immunity protein n=1 Tax=Kitasatospora azatica TaxID=58347 RepID=UPI00056C05AC|nr:Imm21 family immunity protein [Kitasatospora azatica]
MRLGPRTDWLNTDFGRYVLCPASQVGSWQGTEADEVDMDAVGRVRIGGLDALTLAGEPLQICYLADTMTFARQVFADDDELLPGAVRQAVADGEWDEGFTVRLGGRYLLMDLALPGATGAGESLEIVLPYGLYQVLFTTVTPTEDAQFRLDRLRAAS